MPMFADAHISSLGYLWFLSFSPRACHAGLRAIKEIYFFLPTKCFYHYYHTFPVRSSFVKFFGRTRDSHELKSKRPYTILWFANFITSVILWI